MMIYIIGIKKIIYLFFFILNYYISLYTNYVVALYTEPVLLEPSEMHLINWKCVLLEMLRDVFFFDNIKNDSLLLVNLVRNNTSSILQINNITNTLIQCIVENTHKYSVVDIGVLNSVYRALGVFPEDKKNSYNFSMKIANYLKADYILYSTVYGDAKRLNLELQLILVKTGEIVRVVNGFVQV